jgi:hypothetical protein
VRKYTYWMIVLLTMPLYPGCGLGDRGSIPGGGERIFPLACVQTGSWAYPASCSMCTGCPFPEATALPGRDSDHSPPSTAEVDELEL